MGDFSSLRMTSRRFPPGARAALRFAPRKQPRRSGVHPSGHGEQVLAGGPCRRSRGRQYVDRVYAPENALLADLFGEAWHCREEGPTHGRGTCSTRRRYEGGLTPG
jgi:hypothetical protein